MTLCPIPVKTVFWVGLLVGALSAQGRCASAETGDQVRRTVEQSIDVMQQLQKSQDTWAGRRAQLLARYRSLQAENKRLEQINGDLGQRLALEEKAVVEARRKVESAHWIENELQAYLESVVARLEAFIQTDLPFLPAERSQRVASVKECLLRPDSGAAEKYRRVMEALQIEAEYGRSAEVVQQSVLIDGQPLTVDILRLGRIAVFWRTPDGRRAGHFDRATGAYAPLDSRYHGEIEKAMEIARRERTTDLVRLPVGRIVVQ
jgi:hypothetical protein